MRFFLFVQLLFFAIALVGCGDAPANNTAVNTNGVRPTGTPSSSVTPQASPTQTAEKKDEGMFSFPPPRVTSYAPIKNEYVVNPSGATDFAYVADRLTTALTDSGYSEKFAFFRNDQDEFAIVTAMERINGDGSPLAGSDRWITSDSPTPPLPRAHGADEYFRYLFGGKIVFYRVFALVVTSKGRKFNQHRPPDYLTALNWVVKGDQQLAEDGSGGIESTPFTDKHHCYALLYLFVNHTSLDGPRSVNALEGNADGLTDGLERRTEEHLIKTGIAFGAK